MKTLLATILVLSSVSLSNAQVSWMSKPLQSNPYVAPVDMRLLQRAMIHKQSQHTQGYSQIQQVIETLKKDINTLAEVQPNCAAVIRQITNESIEKLNSYNRDYSNPYVVQPIVDHFSEIRAYALKAFRLPQDKFTSDFEFTDFQ